MRRVILASLLILACAITGEAKTYQVTSLDDSGPGTLREVIGLCISGDSIEFDPALSGTIQLLSSLPPISVEYLTLAGPQDLSVSIDGGSAYRIFDVQAGPFSVSNFNLLNGAHLAEGGAIYLAPVVYAQASNLVLTSATIGQGKNPIFLDSNANLDLIDVSFTNQVASQIYLKSANLNLTASSSLSYLIDGTIASSFSKFGTGAVQVSPPSSQNPGYAIGVVEGLLSFSGTMSSICTVYSSGQLSGNLVSSGLSILGMLEPGIGNQLGSVEVIGDFYVVNGGVEIKLDPSGKTDQVKVSGNMFINEGTLRIIPKPGTYIQGTKFLSFLTIRGGVNGAFDQVDSGGLDVKINYYPAFIQVEILTTTTIQ